MNWIRSLSLGSQLLVLVQSVEGGMSRSGGGSTWERAVVVKINSKSNTVSVEYTGTHDAVGELMMVTLCRTTQAASIKRVDDDARRARADARAGRDGGGGKVPVSLPFKDHEKSCESLLFGQHGISLRRAVMDEKPAGAVGADLFAPKLSRGVDEDGPRGGGRGGTSKGLHELPALLRNIMALEENRSQLFMLQEGEEGEGKGKASELMARRERLVMDCLTLTLRVMRPKPSVEIGSATNTFIGRGGAGSAASDETKFVDDDYSW
jgi:hypothetical protein